MYPLTLALLSLNWLGGCGKESAPELPGVTDQNATLLAFNPEGEMIDFVHVTPEAHIDRVEFLAPENGEQITVVGIGPSVHPDFPIKQSVSSKKAEGFMGKVTAEIEDGVVQQLSGNSISFGSPLKLEHLEQIKTQLGEAAREHSKLTTIIPIDPAVLELKADGTGNQKPADLTPAESEFLETVIQAIRAKDLDTLQRFTHREEDDRSSYDTVGYYLKSVLEKDLHHYRFMRFNPQHPNNSSKLELHDGRPIRYSLEPKWILTIHHTPEDAYMRYSADLIIGEDDGQLQFPSSYADQ